MLKKLAFLASSVIAMQAVHAADGQMYGAVGLPGLLTVGFAQPMGENWGVRAEVAGGLNKSTNSTRQGVAYNGKIKSSRIGAYADWFPANNGFRVSGGLTINDTRANLHADSTNNATITINGTPMVMAPGNQLDVKVYQPNVTPYIGIGYGFQPKTDKGWGFNADFGLMLGKFKTSYTQVGIVGTNGITQADLDAEIDKVRKDVNKLNALPSLSVGVNYRF